MSQRNYPARQTPNRARDNDYPKMTLKFVLITGGSAFALMFGLSRLFDLVPQIASSTLAMSGFIILAFALGWLACLVNDVYIRPHFIEPRMIDRNRRAALRELGLEDNEERN